MIPPRIEAEILQWPGATIGSVETGGKHRRVTLFYGGRERFVTLPVTPSDWRAELNQVRDVRKVLTELGATRNARRKAKARRERNRPVRDPLFRVERAPVKANPFETLAQIQFAPTLEVAPRKGHLREALRRLGGSVRRMVARWRSHAPKGWESQQLTDHTPSTEPPVE